MEHYLNRELSWIDFNERVLSEALREDNPLLERLKFLAIVSSNFDEFLMVRVANLINESEMENRAVCPSGMRPSEILPQALGRIREVEKKQYDCLNRQILPGLRNAGIRIMGIDENLPDDTYSENLFKNRILPLLTPLGSGEEGFDSELLKKGSLHLYVRLKKKTGERDVIIPVPENLPRFFLMPDEKSYLLVEAIIFQQMQQMFPGEIILQRAIFRILRDADLSVDEKRDENFMKAMEEILENRGQSRPIILEHMACNPVILKRLQQIVKIPDDRCFSMDGPLLLNDFFGILKHPGAETLLFPPPVPCLSPAFPEDSTPWKVILEKDVLMHHPYESFRPVIQLLQKAAEDPKVLAIKMTIYRTSGDSPIIQALLEAASKGKQVTVLVELKARFDEMRNIRWAKKLTKAGALLIYGIAGLKVHAKAMLIVRAEKEGIRRYLHLGTGNYNDKTAELYTDFSLMTSRVDLTDEAARFFNALTGYSDPPPMRNLAMAPFTLRTRLVQLIEREISHAEQGEKARFIAKLNSLNDPDMVALIYRASQAGVKVDLNVRGICSVIPGIKGVSENIRVVSIVGRYLEHARGYCFHNGGKEELYLSSADWMPRNLDRRVELLFPLQDKELKKQLKMVLEYSLEDRKQAHWLNSKGQWHRPESTQEEHRSSQEYLEGYYRERLERHEKTERDLLHIRRTLSKKDLT